MHPTNAQSSHLKALGAAHRVFLTLFTYSVFSNADLLNSVLIPITVAPSGTVASR